MVNIGSVERDSASLRVDDDSAVGLIEVSDDLHLAMFNSAVFGSLILCSNGQFTLTQTIGFCLGSGIGFTVATLYVAEGQRKIRNREVPGSFKGLPVTLLYIGILSLCIYSFTGYSLGN